MIATEAAIPRACRAASAHLEYRHRPVSRRGWSPAGQLGVCTSPVRPTMSWQLGCYGAAARPATAQSRLAAAATASAVTCRRLRFSRYIASSAAASSMSESGWWRAAADARPMLTPTVSW